MTDVVKCVFCKQLSKKKDWDEDYEECELCGSHLLATCPKCGEKDEGAYSNPTKAELAEFNK